MIYRKDPGLVNHEHSPGGETDRGASEPAHKRVYLPPKMERWNHY